jgi:thiamine biosynthesis lipoprotein
MSQTVSFPAFGTTAVVGAARPARLELARGAVQSTVATFDRACSRFRDDSEISKLARAGGAPFHASPTLIDAIGAALEVARMTDGDVDPTVGRALVALGYDRDFSQIEQGPNPGRIELVPAAGYETVSVDLDAATVHVPRGVSLDLGASAKALAADRAAQAAHIAAGCGVLVSFGGDIALAGDPPPGGWNVRVTDDHRSPVSAPGQAIVLHAGGLATSSTTARRWKLGPQAVHHLLDPRTGRPAAGQWRTVSVAAASCLHANAASTAAIIRGARAADWLASLGLPSRLVSNHGRAVHLAGWPAEGEELAA